MAALYRIKTNDLTIRCWDQTVQIDGVPGSVWFGRKFSRTEAGRLGAYFQMLVDAGRNQRRRPPNRRSITIVADENLVQLNEELKDTVDELELEIEGLKNGW